MMKNFIFLSLFTLLLIALTHSTMRPAAIHITTADTSHPIDPGLTLAPIPDAPTPEAYSPNSIQQLLTADPTQGISIIHPPTANNTGNANLDFQMQLPQGRQGMTPILDIQYNNEGGSSWLGTGWNLPTPGISIDTRWGVPRYDPQYETEIYLLNGDQLAPINNRSALISRTTDKQFFRRVEGSFNRIIRHGDSPSTYWWEVVDKNGTHYSYGGTTDTKLIDAAVLKDDSNHVAYWALVEMRDANDNYIHYVYQTVQDPGNDGSSQMGRQLYLSQVTYTGFHHTEGAYKVAFTRDRQLQESRRKDVSIDCRLGFKSVSADLLRRIDISINDTLIRSYAFHYHEGAFYKTLLDSVSELDDAGAVFYSHRFDYYDDVNIAQGYIPTTGINTWNMPGDGIKGDLVNPVPGFTSEGSAIATSQADSRSGGTVVTVGSAFSNIWSKQLSVGGGFNYGEDEEKDLLSLTDINGDGLPDKVFKQGGSLFYRANLGDTARRFGPIKPIAGISDIGTTHTKNVGGGVQVMPPAGFLGYNHTTSTTTTKVYFSDFNGDGLMDVASDGQVYFNHLNAQGDPEFTLSSSPTPNPIVTGSIDQSFQTKDTALQRQQEEEYPLQDVIRMWEAPFSGTVSITAPVQLQQVPSQSGATDTKLDGVRASIQLGGNQLWSTTIAATDFSVKNPSGVSALPIQKGQRVYFRLQSRYNGDDDLVSWDPLITYSNPITASSDFKTSGVYQASTDYILHNIGPTGMGKDGTISIDGSFSKKITSDSVTLQIIRTHDSLSSVYFERSYGPQELADGDLAIPGPLAVFNGDAFRFLIISHSYIDRSALLWRPHYAYISFSDNTPATSSEGTPILQGYPVCDNSNFNRWIFVAAPVTASRLDTVILWPQISGTGALNGTCWFTVKGDDSIVARRKIFVTGGIMDSTMDSIRVIRHPGERWFLEFAADSQSFASTLRPPAVAMYKDSILKRSALPDTMIRRHDTLVANLYTNPDTVFLGPMFRGWGQFVLKGDKGDGPLNESSLNLNELNSYSSDPSQFQDSSSLSTIKDPSKTDFVMLSPNGQKQSWVGYDTSVYITAGDMSSARLWMHDVTVDSLMSGGSAAAVNKVNTTKTESVSLGIQAGLTGSEGVSTATTTFDMDMMDMNGDLYPDVVNGPTIQYTLPNGGLGSVSITHNVGQTNSTGSSTGFSLGGEYSKASTENTTSKGAVSAEQVSEFAAGMTGSINSNTDETGCSWADVNGDGLLDRIYKDGMVALNMGYHFAPAEQWDIAGIERGSSTSIGAGLGVNIDDNSYSGGVGLSRTTADNSFMLGDVNGDGLPDQLSVSDGAVTVRLNTGKGFGPSFSWKDFSSVTSNISTGESIDAAFTIGIPIIYPPFVFLKIDINPSVNIGHGVSKQQDVIMDLDGDGFADLLHSDNDGNLTASSSTIGRTNMLRTVYGPLGSSFRMDYERIGNSYDMPQSKWVLRNVSTFDGLAGDGVDTSAQQFVYSGGYQDRREREFYGFARVITRDLNTAHGNSIYRSHIRQFLNTDYYSKGLPASEWLEDAAGNKYNQTNYTYDLRVQQENITFPALTQIERLFYEGGAAPGVSTMTQYDYDALGNITQINDAGDGSQQDLILAKITYQDLPQLYIKSIPASIEVTTAEGLKRRRTTTVDDSGNITLIQRFLSGDNSDSTTLDYDDYGNLTHIGFAANYKGQKMTYSYTYDDVVHNYMTGVTDAFGYTTSNTWNYRYGALTGSVNRNNEATRYTLDNHGRVLQFIGPHELASGKPYTIAFSYHTDPGAVYAVSRHYDPEYNGDMLLIHFCDGLGRSVQVKRQMALFKGKGQADQLAMAVSGRAILDAFGRTEKSYFPVIEAMGSNDSVINNNTGGIQASHGYDVKDRETSMVLADGASSRKTYTAANNLFSMLNADELGNQIETLTDVRERKRAIKKYGDAGIISNNFDYDALGEVVRATDDKGNGFTAVWDNLGRKTSVVHPDAGATSFVYDMAGNLMKKITARIAKQMPDTGAIRYQYDYTRLTDVDYPVYYQNKIKYTYGKPGTGSKAGRVILQEDASGGQEFFYGMQGVVNKVIRTVLTSASFSTTYVTQQDFDTWNRLKKLTYPDGEAVTYHYNKGGRLYSMDGSKLGNAYAYVNQLGYDQYDARVYMLYGNGTETKYGYDSLRRHLVTLQASDPTGKAIMSDSYLYDPVGHVTGRRNDTYAQQQFHFDELYQIDSATGQYGKSGSSASFGMRVLYDDLFNITQKNMRGTQTYQHGYRYGGAGPHQATQIGADKYDYDADGNQLGYGDVENYYDEENRLIGVVNKGVLSQYTYDAGGDRAVKSSGGLQSVWVNGAPAGTVNHYDNYTSYVSPYISCRKNGFVKHYFIDNQRIVSKEGHGTFTNISFPQSGLTAGNIDYVARAAQLSQAMQAYYASLGVSPGPPTDKNYYAEAVNSGIPAPVIVDSTASQTPVGWPGNTTPPPNGPPVYVTPAPSNDSVQAGYGFEDAGQFPETGQYFYHADWMGNTNYLTNLAGAIGQHVEYAPSGETFLEESKGSFTTAWLYGGGERDEETGYYHAGSRYYDPALSSWLSVEDPSGVKYPNDGAPGYGLEEGETMNDLFATSLGNPDSRKSISNGQSEFFETDIEGKKNDRRKRADRNNASGKPSENMHVGKLASMHEKQKAFRKPKGGMQNNAMFYNANHITMKRYKPTTTRPRR